MSNKSNKWFLGFVVLLMSLLVTGCGISQGDYDAVVAEGDEAQAEVLSLQNELDQLESKIELTENEVESLENDLATAESERLSLESDLTLAKEKLERMEAEFGKLLFFDDFEDGDLEGWNIYGEGGWAITSIQEDDNYFLEGVVQGRGHAHSAILASNDWTDYTLATKFNLNREVLAVNFRAATPQLSERYYLGIHQEWLILHKSPPPSMPVLAQTDLSPRLEGWNNLKVEVVGGNIKVYVNGVLQINYTDPEPLERGGINFELGDYSHIYLDNVAVATTK